MISPGQCRNHGATPSMRGGFLIYALVVLLSGCDGVRENGERAKPGAPAILIPESLRLEPTGETELAPTVRFEDETIRRGIDFVHFADRSAERYLPEIMGSGVAVADFNRDGAPDIYLVGGGAVSRPEERPAGALDRLFLNEGDGFFRDASASWLVGGTGYGMGVATGDFDNDGFVDLFLTTFGGKDRLLRNTGQQFVDVTIESGISVDDSWSTSAGFLDIENDGDLDLYVTKYIDYNRSNAIRCYGHDLHIYCTPTIYAGVPDRLYRNNGDGTFTDISYSALLVDGIPLSLTTGKASPNSVPEPAKIDPHACKGLAVGIRDINEDGFQDIYVANDVSRNLLFINDGKGVFSEIGRSSGVAYGQSGDEQAGMGVDFGYVDDDDRLDIVCTNFQGEPVNVYCQLRNLAFVDQCDRVGVGMSTRRSLGFGIRFLDVNNDGREDLLVVNGHICDNVAEFITNAEFAQKNTLLLGTFNHRFSDISELAGAAAQVKQVSRGLAVADFNGDGKVDYVVSNNGDRPLLAINHSETGNFVSLWLEGTTTNRSAIGAKVIAHLGETTLRREISGASSYLSSSAAPVHLGIGEATEIDNLEIFWPGGGKQETGPIAAGKFYRIQQGSPPETYTPGSSKD